MASKDLNELNEAADLRYALNVKKGSTINHPDVDLPGGIAIPVSLHTANQLKNIANVVVFDKVQGVDEEEIIKNNPKSLHGLDYKESKGNIDEHKPLEEVKEVKKLTEMGKETKAREEQKRKELLKPVVPQKPKSEQKDKGDQLLPTQLPQ